jgi:D-alanyl-D-alanine carboxypeptidase
MILIARTRTLTAATAALAVLAAGAPAARAASAGAVPATGATMTAASTYDPVQRSLERLVVDARFPAAMASVREPDGLIRNYTAGVSDLGTQGKVPVDGRIRIASNTKMFTATVVLQLVGEGKIRLDEPIEKHLPKVVRGKGIDGRRITVRQLLQHTSGLPDYDDKLFADFVAAVKTYHEPYELLKVAFSEKAASRPGSTFSYSNTNYIVAGLLAQRVTGRPIGELITKRVIEPLGLHDTYWPDEGELTIRGAHPRGYLPAMDGKAPVDITESDPSPGWAAGALIGTPSDLNRFLAGLFGGRLLKPAQLAEMKRTVDAPGFDTVGGSRYGLGVATFKLSCGGFAWTHGGIAPGYVTADGVTGTGRAATVAVTSLISTEQAAREVDRALDTALCT